MTLRDFAILALGDEGARHLPRPALERRLEELARRENWWKLIGPKAAPPNDFPGTLKRGGVPLSGGEEIPW